LIELILLKGQKKREGNQSAKQQKQAHMADFFNLQMPWARQLRALLYSQSEYWDDAAIKQNCFMHLSSFMPKGIFPPSPPLPHP
jgi:hypothetical protein